MADRRVSWILILAAVLVRAGLVLAVRSHEVPRSTYEHGEIAENLLAGRGFAVKFLGADGPTSQQAPVYPVIVAAAYAIGGGPTPRSLLILELGQSILGGCLVWGAMKLAREAAPGHPSVWPSRIAGFVVAFDPSLVYAATHVQVALTATLLLTLSLAQGYQASTTGRPRDALLAGVWLGLLMLTDPILGLASLGVGWVIARGFPFDPEIRSISRWKAGFGSRQSVRLDATLRTVLDDPRPSFHHCPLTRSEETSASPGLTQLSVPRRVGLVAIVATTAMLVLLPWTIRNYRAHGEFVAVKSTFGYAFWQGNCTLSEGTDKVVRASVDRALSRSGSSLRDWNRSLWKARHEAGYIDDIALTKADYLRLGRVSEPERSRILFRKAVADLRAEPGRYLRLCLRRLRYFVFFDETNPKTRNLIYRATHLGLTIFACVGIVLMPKSARKRLGPTFLTAFLITLFHSLTIVSARFHLPIEPLMAIWGASAFVRASKADSKAGIVASLESAGEREAKTRINHGC